MRRHLDDHSGVNTTVYSNTPLQVHSGTTVSNSHITTPSRSVSEIDGRVVVPGISATVTVTETGVTSPPSLPIHHQSRTFTSLPGSSVIGINKPLVQRQPLALIQETVHAVGSTGNSEMQSGVQYSVQTGYQPRVSAATVPQVSHSHNTPTTGGHHTHPQQQVVHQAQTHSQAHAAQMQGQQQQQFQRLKVEDALSYLDQVKFKFGNQPQVYNDFLDIMKEFKSQSIDTPGVIQRVSNLFRGHPELIVGFNTFLPPGYRIEVQPNEQVQVSMPGSNSGPGGSSSGGPTSITIHPGGNHGSSSVHPPPGSQSNHSSHSSTPHHPPNSTTKQSTHHIPVTSNQTHHSTSHGQHSYHQNSPAHGPSTSPGLLSPSAPQTSQPVEFNHAINYVNKIKNRFQGQPDIYKQFLEILHTYQKEQRSLKEGVHTGTKPLTEAEVYAQVAKLFQNQEDLLQEFGQFLPDANGAASILVCPELNLQPAKAVNNDHTPVAKKPAVPKPLPSPANNQAKQVTSVKRPPAPVPLQPTKKPRMTSLKDVTLAEAGKFGTLNEFAFFDKVRKSLRSHEAYENFLRAVILYNQEIISRPELVQLVTPFLGKYFELFKWFKDFLGYKDPSSNTNNNSTTEALPNKVAPQERERVAGDFATEIDYSSCKKYGASYRAVPKNYVQPKCSGRTMLCREVLNDTWVSFPSWSEDSTFVSSRKTQYEEYIYRCEDERFELDVVLETNLASIRALEAVQKKINRMTPEEKARLRLDDTFGGSSAVLHHRAIKKIYGDKAPDIIDGLKKNPVVAVPLVLRRLKVKEEEWRKAQKSFNKMWRDQNEKYYLKSLDHQGITFKQNDVKLLRSKSLLNEIESIFEERHEQAEENNCVPSGTHTTVTYRDKKVLVDAANLIIHHVKRQTGIHKDDKQKIKQLLRQFIPDYFSIPRGELSDDEMEKDEMETDDGNSDGQNPGNTPIRDSSGFNLKCSDTYGSRASGCSTDGTNQNNCIKNNHGQFADVKNSDKINNTKEYTTVMENLNPDDFYNLFFVNNNWYLFFRLHHILCERLCKINECSTQLILDEINDRKERKESTAVALRLKPKNEIEVEHYYAAFLEMVKNLLDGNMDSNQYEDTLREMFGIHAYIVFTLDKVVQNAVRQLQHIVGDESCTLCTALFIEEQRSGAAGGACSSALTRSNAETAYQKKAEQLFSEENCFKIILYKEEGKMTFELLDTDTDASEDPVEVEKWSEYAEKYASGEESVSEELKEQLSKMPVFLPRNVRIWRQRATKMNDTSFEDNIGDGDKADDTTVSSEIDKKKAVEVEKAEFGSGSVATNSNSNSSTSRESIGGGDAGKNTSEETRKELMPDKMQKKQDDEVGCKFNVNSYKMVFFVHGDGYMYKRMALKRARQSHRRVSQRLNQKFRSWHTSWTEKNVSQSEGEICKDWLMGFAEDMSDAKTICVREDNPSRPPYSPFNRYRLRIQEKT